MNPICMIVMYILMPLSVWTQVINDYAWAIPRISEDERVMVKAADGDPVPKAWLQAVKAAAGDDSIHVKVLTNDCARDTVCSPCWQSLPEEP